MYTEYYTGFSELEYEYLSLLCTFIGLKCAQLKEKYLSELKEKRCIETISTVASLLETRMYPALLVRIRQTLPSILGYENVGIYLYDSTCNLYIYIVANELCTYLDNNNIPECETLLRYPTSEGLTGKVFNTDSIIISHKGMSSENSSEIDNADIEIRDFTFMPTYGFDNTRNGVLQLFNRLQGGINNNEALKYYQKLIGLIMQNVKEGDKAMNIGLRMKGLLESLKDKTNIYQLNEVKYSSTLDDLEMLVDNLKRIIINNEKKARTLLNLKPLC